MARTMARIKAKAKANKKDTIRYMSYDERTMYWLKAISERPEEYLDKEPYYIEDMFSRAMELADKSKIEKLL